jgi:hypothetical protein
MNALSFSQEDPVSLDPIAEYHTTTPGFQE